MDTPSTTDGPIPLMKPTAPVTVATPPPPAPVIAATPVPQVRKGNWGGLIGIILIVFVITVAAFYSWGERLATQSPPYADTDTGE